MTEETLLGMSLSISERKEDNHGSVVRTDGRTGVSLWLTWLRDGAGGPPLNLTRVWIET